jgi:tetratricopeptide (TPR) repeat protein
VVDAGGSAIAGVRVSVTSEQLTSFQKTLTTNAKGEFRLRFQATQVQYDFQFLFEKPGYQSFTQPMTLSVTRQMREQFVMDEAESQVVESHGDLASIVTGSSSAAVEAFNAGLTAQRAGDLGVAGSKYQAAIEADPSLGSAHVALAQVLIDQGEHAAAVAAADRALELAVGRAEALRVKHQALRALGRNAEAEAVGEQMVEAEGAVASAHRLYNEGGKAFQAGDQDTALAKFHQAAEMNPALVDAHHAIATLELAKGNHEASAAAAEAALAMGSEDIRTLRVLYDAYDAMGRTDQLFEIAPRLAAVDPDFGGSKLLEQAAAMWNGGQAERAVALSRLALSIDPALAKAYYFVGLDHVSKGENAEARAALQKFIDLAPEDLEVATAREMLTYID